MKRVVLLALLLLAMSAMAAPSPDEYSTNIHVRSSHLLYANGAISQMLDVTINGKKYELAGFDIGGLLVLGDYKAKLVKDEHKTSYESDQIYEFLFPDKKTRKFTVVGQSE